ncbi:MAG: DUF3078 domain-containing protein [Candidatus Firestonebacteria bacterium]|nr:DUF3078 domain-containing protein [Candidatus Firestonebacteria bacterium]
MQNHKSVLAIMLAMSLGAIVSTAWGAEPPAGPAPGTVAPPAAVSAAVPTPAPTPQYGWNQDILSKAGLSQSRFDNWAQGGEESLAWQVSFLGKVADDEADYNWGTTLKMGFGQFKSGNAELKKTTDEIVLDSVVVYKLGIQVDPYVSLKGLTQFASGYDYSLPEKVQTSAFLDPGYFIESLGFGYTRPEVFNTRLGFAVRETVTKDFPHYADNPETADVEKTKVEPGMESVTSLNLKLNELMRFTTNLALFSNFKAADQIVVRWDNMVSVTLTQYITAGFDWQLFYDKTVSVRRQLSQMLTVGLAYQFSSKDQAAVK